MQELKYSEILSLNTLLSKQDNERTSLRIAILGNVTVNPLKEILQYALRLRDIEPQIEIGNYDNIIQDAQKYKDFDAVIVFYDLLKIRGEQPLLYETFSTEDIKKIEQRVCRDIDLIFSILVKTKTVIFNDFSCYGYLTVPQRKTKIEQTVDFLNTYLQNKSYPNFTILNIDKIISLLGISSALDMRMYRSSKAPYSLQFLKQYALSTGSIIANQNGKAKKAIIFDCDHTLWNGILGEDGPEGINMSAQNQIGAIYNTVQQLAAYLSKQGVLIGLCSKNNKEDVYHLLETHKDVALKQDYIVIDRINWQDKVTNLREIAQEINIGLDSIVFVDDSDFEINYVRKQLPQLATFQVPKNIYDYANQFLEMVYNYFPLQATHEDLNKISQYKDQQKREQAKENYGSIENYIASLHIRITAHINDRDSIERIAQLTQKTNQFNLTTKRYTAIQIREYLDNPNVDVFSFDISDDFGDSGLTAVAIVVRNGLIANIDTFLMSCRIIGRHIEKTLIDYMVNQSLINGCEIIKGAYYPTAKNAQVSNLYEQFGFTIESVDGSNKEYSMEIKKYKNHGNSYIKI
jgi:FkbH-like protein